MSVALGSQRRRGIALPMVLMVLVALGLLSALALSDALLAARGARFGDAQVRTRAALVAFIDSLSRPPDLAWLCLQPPSVPTMRARAAADGVVVTHRWWYVGAGMVRVELDARGPEGVRHRRIGWMRVEPMPGPDDGPGCPAAVGLRPADPSWLTPHPEG